MRSPVTLTILTVALLATAAPLFSHHSISGAYFTDQQVRVEGTVVEFNYRNPHSTMEIQGIDPKSGQPKRWGIEWGSLKRLERDGVSKDSIKNGDHILLLGNPSRTVGDKMLWMVGVIRKADGWKWGKSVE
jgi:hypothetical protein